MSVYKRRAVGESIGAVLVLIMLIAAAAALTFAIAYMYSALAAAHSAQVAAGRPARENLSLVYVAHVPPSGSPGVVVMNEGIPVTIVEVLQVVGSNVVAQPVDIPLSTGASATIPLQSGEFALVTSSGAVFTYNMGNESYLSLAAFGVRTDPPPGLYYASGSLTLRSLDDPDALWVVNGSQTEVSPELKLTVDGPTAVTVIQH